MVSSIYTAQNNGSMSDIWKFASNFYMATLMSTNVLALYIITNNHLFYHQLDFMIMNWTKIVGYNFLINLALYCVIPFMLINYFLVFKDDKYKMLIKEFKASYSKKAFLIYFAICLVLSFSLLFLKK